MTEYKTKITFCGRTDPGLLRTNNEDAFVVHEIWDKDHVLAVAIDGVGGYEGGEVAAQAAQEVIPDFLVKYPNGERLDLLKQAVVEANNAIIEKRKQQENLANMSCVLTAALVEVQQKRINMVHVGDTRLYQYHKDRLTKLSHDHSLIGYREEIGDLTEDEAMHHPQRNIISRDVGSAHHEVDDRDFLEAETFPLLPNSTLLLCSDGLCDMITTARIREVLRQEIPLEQKAAELIEAAKDAGGHDNITVVLVEYQSDEPEEAEEAKEEPAAIPENIRVEPIIQTPKRVVRREEEPVASDGNKRRRIFAWLAILLAAGLIVLYVLASGILKTGASSPEPESVERPAVEQGTTPQPAGEEAAPHSGQDAAQITPEQAEATEESTVQEKAETI